MKLKTLTLLILTAIVMASVACGEPKLQDPQAIAEATKTAQDLRTRTAVEAVERLRKLHESGRHGIGNYYHKESQGYQPKSNTRRNSTSSKGNTEVTDEGLKEVFCEDALARKREYHQLELSIESQADLSESPFGGWNNMSAKSAASREKRQAEEDIDKYCK